MLEIKMGAFSPLLHEQLQLQKEDLEHIQKDADAITRLLVRGIITESEGHRARKRIIKELEREITEGKLWR